MEIILASASPRRRDLLARIAGGFSVIPSDADESLPDGIAPDAAVMLLAQKKAEAVAALPQSAGCCVIGADTVVVIDGRILGKPADRDAAVAMLELFSGRTHTVYTGMSVLTPAGRRVSSTATDVTFYTLTSDEISAYVDSGEPYDKAGGYGIQDGGCILVKSISGDYYNVMGMPVAVLYRQLRELCVI